MRPTLILTQYSLSGWKERKRDKWRTSPLVDTSHLQTRAWRAFVPCFCFFARLIWIWKSREPLLYLVEPRSGWIQGQVSGLAQPVPHPGWDEASSSTSTHPPGNRDRVRALGSSFVVREMAGMSPKHRSLCGGGLGSAAWSSGLHI